MKVMRRTHIIARFPTGVSALLVANLALAQSEPGPAPAFSIVPRISVSERFTNNVAVTSSGKKSELVTQSSPVISLRSNSGRL